MIHTEDPTKSLQSQFKCRTRRCLCKGCTKTFKAKYPASRYCSKECRDKVHIWRNKRAQKRYRKTAKSKAKRSTQARNRRRRKKDSPRTKCAQSAVCVGHHNESDHRFICARPGCYSYITPTRSSPCKKYCSKPCSSSMHRVMERERRWRKRVKHRKR